MMEEKDVVENGMPLDQDQIIDENDLPDLKNESVDSSTEVIATANNDSMGNEGTISIETTNNPNINESDAVLKFEDNLLNNSSSASNDKANVVVKHGKHKSFQSRIISYIICLILSIVLFVFSFTSYRSLIREKSTYEENASVSYQVCLRMNNYYSEKCLGEDAEYVAAITDSIRAVFNYNAVYQDKEKKTVTYYVKSKVQFKTSDEEEREYLSKEDVLTNNKVAELNGNVLNIVETVEFPFDTYNAYAQDYKNEYSLVNDSVFSVSLVLKEGNEEREVASIIMPLTKLSYNIRKNVIPTQTIEYNINSNKKLKYGLICGMVLGIVLIVISFILLIRFLLKTRVKTSSYEKKLKQILSTYDRVIVTLDEKNTINDDPHRVYKVKSFLELLDVRDTIDKPILYYRVNSIKTEFYVQDTKKTYKYTMKESDFEDK